ncbi:MULTISPECIES: alpha/beta fold hydrolase [unclassified Nonomuraea]|uniref:alpha/beta fold hydrolase n=1 Tax=unclassified Nonomuraea TaxID=2593643 RepID=UPI001F2C4A1F|nr:MULTISPECIES: alpha/beta fold hydrolase [unclassified Nonomuraea]
MVKAGEVGIAWEEAGPEEPVGTVVLLHAAVADMRVWDHQFAALSRRHPVVRYAMRGHGRSGDADDDDDDDEVCHHEDLLALMDAARIERAALIGSSMGGAYAVEAALAAPSRVAALVLIGSGLTGHQWPREMLDQARERFTARFRPTGWPATAQAPRIASIRPTCARWPRTTRCGRSRAPAVAATPSPTRCGRRRWRCAGWCRTVVVRPPAGRTRARSARGHPSDRDRRADPGDQRPVGRARHPGRVRPARRGRPRRPPARPAGHGSSAPAGAARGGEPGGVGALRAAVDLLTDSLLSHLSYEERELVEPLARHGF